MKPIYLILKTPEHKIETGASRFWGNPDLPTGVGYPMYTDNEGDEYPYCFICQINLGDLAPYDSECLLPHKGLLSFFAKIDRYLGEWDDADGLGGVISDKSDVRVFYFPDIDDLRETVLVDDDDNPLAIAEMAVGFSLNCVKYGDEHALFAHPTHREWEAWESPYEDWLILMQVDSFEGEDFELNFMDCGVLDMLISPEDLRKRDFRNVRGIVLST